MKSGFGSVFPILPKAFYLFWVCWTLCASNCFLIIFSITLECTINYGKFPSPSSTKRKAMLKFWLWWHLLCLLSIRMGWLDIHFLTVRCTSKHLPLLAFSFLRAAVWPHNFFYPSLLRQPSYFQIWAKISPDNLGATAKYWIEIVSLWRWNENATYSDTDLKSFLNLWHGF